MRIDLFEFVEGLIRGIVYFLYNVLGSLWQILRAPVRGPLRLHRQYLKHGQKQIGGLTLLFLFLLIFFGLVGTAPDDQPITAKIMAMMSKRPNFEGQATWRPILGALGATILIDSALRLFLRWRLPERQKRRQLVLAATEFALVLPIVAVVAAAVVIDSLRGPGWDDNQFYLLTVFAFPLGLMATFVPATFILLTGSEQRTFAWQQPQREYVGGLMWIAGFGAVVGLLWGAAAIGNNLMEDRGPLKKAARRLVPTALHCNFATKPAMIDIALHNPTDQAIILRPFEELQLIAFGKGSEADESETYDPVAEDGDSHPILFEPGEMQLLRFNFPIETLKSPDVCFVFSTSVSIDWTKQDWGGNLQVRLRELGMAP